MACGELTGARIPGADFDLRKIADSGQCFRLNEELPGVFRLTALGRTVLLREADGDWDMMCGPGEFEAVWRPYFDLDADYGAYRAAVPETDAFLTAAVRRGTGIRILRQDPWEMLVTFIISQQKNIPAIRRCVETLCSRYGAALDGAHDFPAPQALAAGEAALRDCALGYRAGYVLAAAQRVASGETDLTALAALDDPALLEKLMEVPGVGIKVANCVALFGYHRIGAFPRDVWINRVVRQHYRGRFPLYRYRGFAGVIQQYMFYDARSAASAGEKKRP